MSRFLALCLLVPFCAGLSITEDLPITLTVQKTTREFEEEIHSNYSKLHSSAILPPVHQEGEEAHPHLHVKVDTYVRDVTLKELSKDFYEWSVELSFRQKWNDSRLEYDTTHYPDFKYVHLSSPECIASIWKPDTFFTGAIEGNFHHVLAPNTLVWVYPCGKVIYSTRISLKLHCHPQKEDGQDENKFVCPVRFASYGHTTDKLEYDWDEAPIEIREHIYIPHYTLDKVETAKSSGKTKIGEWSSLTANFHFTHHKE